MSASLSAQDQVVTISATEKLQTVKGWGVSLCWWAKEVGVWPEEDMDQLVDWLVSPEHLNYNVFRYNIPGGDDPQHRNCKHEHMKGRKGLRAEMDGFKEYEDSPYNWEADSAQIKIMKKIIARCHYYGKEAIIEAFANTPPYWMTVSGCCSGAADPNDTNLKPDYYGAFAQYLIDVCQHFKEEEGIEFYSLEPFNEAYTNYWYCGGQQEGCGFYPKDQVVFVKEHLAPLLKKSGLKTILAVSDETSEKKSLDALESYLADTESLDALQQWNTHTYWYSTKEGEKTRNENRMELRDKIKGLGKALWMSETGQGGKGIDGNLNLSQTLFDDVRYLQPEVWCDWQYVDSGDQWCLITCSGNADKYFPPFKRNKNFFVRSQVSKYIKSGYSILTTSQDNVLAATDAENSALVVCVLNKEDKAIEYKLNIEEADNLKLLNATITDSEHDNNGFDCPDITKITMPARSIVTLEFQR